MSTDHLTFEVAPHIVQDLGLNLYTSLPRVLVEFIANAHDADSPTATVDLDIDQIIEARRRLKEEYLASRRGDGASGVPSTSSALALEAMTLPDEVTIVIEDRGHGMSREDLQNKFLRVGRRRREEEGILSPGGRVLMGRKGLGKLAGFGVAHRIEVLSRKHGDSHATEIVLEYERLVEKQRANDVLIPVRTIANGGGLEPHGTRVTLSRLVYDPAKSQPSTIVRAIGEHFWLTGTDFSIQVAGEEIAPSPRTFAYAYPQPDLPHSDFVPHSCRSEDDRELEFTYRIRFTGEKQHLPATQRGVRLYSHGRLAAAPDLLDVKTGIHGFRNTHYLDAIVHADSVDDQREDYIATDRHTLRWESPFLEPLRNFLTAQMEEACNAYQKVRDENAEDEVKSDTFTRKLIAGAKLPKHRERLAYRVARSYASVCEDGIEGPEYQERLTIFVDGVSQGDILKTLRRIAAEDNPDLQSLVAEVTELTARELGDFMKYVEGRMSGIAALQKLCAGVDFKAKKNEDELHALLRDNPWLIDVTFTQFLTSNEAEQTLQGRLAKELKIGAHTPDGYDSSTPDETGAGGKNKRPDLVFLLSNNSLNRLVIVELKAPNTPLYGEHLRQLQNYMRRAKDWLTQKGKGHYIVQGYLIGSRGSIDSKADDVLWLEDQIEQSRNEGPWRVYDLLEILDLTEKAHDELIGIYKKSTPPDVSSTDDS
jgi:hypothetical protein